MFLNIAFKSLINKLLNVLVVVLFVGIGLAFWLDLAKIFIFMQIMGAVVMVSIVITAVFALKNKQPFARYYLLAIAFLIVFSFMEIAHGSLGKPHYFLLAHLEWAFLFEVAVLAYGLNRRFDFEQKQLQKAKEDAQKQAIIHAQKNENLVRNQNHILEEKVQERTEKLQIVNEELVVMNEELQQIQEEITMQRDMLESKNDLLEEYTHKVKKSIQAAQTTQKAILPSKEKMKELFENYFVLFKPKDVVSGDFWWADFLEVKDIGQEQPLANAKKMKYLIVADCTGHGVSGAMLTMIGSALLDRIIGVMDISKPSEILEKLHQEIKIALRQDKTQNNEGMDIAVLNWYEEKNHCVLTFSAAKRPLYYTLEGKINKLSGTRRSIGGTLKVKKNFEEKTFILPKGNSFYLCSDGYIDQNNLERNGFTENRLLNLLQEHQNLEMLAQKNILKQELATHMNGVEQRDDILIIGVRI